MTQFPPLQGPGMTPVGPMGPPPAAYRPPPWSAAAIAGFILSILGCLGITALLGLVLGIVGIVRTSSGRRRGMGLAIAAIPISLVMGVLSVFLLLGTFVAMATGIFVARLPTILSTDASNVANGAAVVREVASEDFNSDVSTEALDTWLKEVAEKHGRLVSVMPGSQPSMPSEPGKFAMNFDGKFVNGQANIVVTFRMRGWRVELDDIQVDGVSPRDVK